MNRIFFHRIFCAGLVAAIFFLNSGCDRQKFIQKPSSMRPTIEPGETIFANMLAYVITAPQRWDVVLFKPPALNENSGIGAFRVIGLPGETVSFDNTGLLINGKKPHLPSALKGINDTPAPKNQPPSPLLPYKVPSDSYFVLGDDPSIANDSRMWGAVSREQIIGKILNK
jgi:signal peptidase I